MTIRFRGALFLFLILFCIQLNADINVINLFSGIPQPSDVGPNRTGGFGDVAANLVAAIELKKRYPEKSIRLLVTSAKDRYLPEVPTSDEIIKIMAPELDPGAKGVSQYYQGVEVLFLDFDFAKLADTKKFERLPEQLEMLMVGANLLIHRGLIRSMIPNADLNLSISYHPYSWPIVSLGAPLSIGVEEVYEDPLGVDFFRQNRRGDSQSGFVKLVGGPLSVGYMLVRPPERNQAWETIHEWLGQQKIDVPHGPFAYTFAYSAIKESIQTYIYAMGELNITEPLVLFVKKYDGLDYSRLPSNVRVVELSGIPHEVMSAFYREAAISPLATGDISLGQALSTITEDRLFVYEAPWWKVGAARELRKIIATELGVHTNVIRALFLTPGTLIHQEPGVLLKKGRELAQILKNKSLVKRIFAILSRRKREWDVLDNLMSYAESLDKSESQQWTREWLSGQLRSAVDSVVSQSTAPSCQTLF